MDLGQARDFTAIAILERAESSGAFDPVQYAYRKVTSLQLRHLERMPLGTPYPEVAARARAVTRSGELAGKCTLIADATGVGRPVVDLLRGSGLGCQLIGVTLTGGESESMADGYYRAPKRDLIVGLQVLLQAGALRIASRLEHGPTLAKEMSEMRVRTTSSGHEQYGAWREGQHDDLVLAVALACWWAGKQYPFPPKGADAYVQAPEWMWAI
jgi:hypothetical protein